jgi:hypothetical protein
MAITTTVRKYWRSLPGSAGINGITLRLKKHSDDSEITNAATAGAGTSAGLATLTSTYTGPAYVTGTNSGTTLYSSSKDVGFIGTISGYDLDVLGLALGSGVVDGQLNEAAVTAAGTDMEVDIDTGAFLVLGHPYRNTGSYAVVIGDNTSGNPRIDRIVLRHTRKGQTEEGQAIFAVVAGTPAASPSAPALTQSAATWEIGLAQVAVANGATSIAQGNLTDERTFVAPVYVDGAVLKALSVATAALADLGVTAGKIAADAVITAKILDANVTFAKLDGGGYFHDTADQTGADTPSTADTVNWATAISITFTLPVGTWEVIAEGGIELGATAGGSADRRVVIDGTAGTTRSNNAGSAGDYFGISSKKASVASGARTCTIQYKSNSGATVTARIPSIRIVARRTA